MQDKLSKKFMNNLTYAFVAQFVSLISSAIMSLLVSKVLGIEQFAYWQLFVFYTTYVGLFHFGLSDGIYLRCGGADADSLDYSLLGSQLKYMNIFHACLCVGIVIFSVAFCEDMQRTYVWIFASIYMVLANTLYFLGFIFQAINETKVYSVSIIISKGTFLLAIALLILWDINFFVPFVFAYLFAHLLGVAYIISKGKRFYISKVLSVGIVLSEIISNIKVGIKLTFSSVASSLILGIGRIIVDMSGGLMSFSVVSLAISLTNFILAFLAQVSLVLFPMLRKIDRSKVEELYEELRVVLSLILCLTLVFFIPLKYVLELWLPKYVQSFAYMTILIPICVFDGKMQMLYNTYMKVLRKERQLMAINVLSMIVSMLLCLISVIVIGNTISVVFSMVIAIVVRSIISSIYLSRNLSIGMEKGLVVEIILSIIFVISNGVLNEMCALLINSISVGLYWYINRKTIRELVQKSKML